MNQNYRRNYKVPKPSPKVELADETKVDVADEDDQTLVLSHPELVYGQAIAICPRELLKY